MVIKELKHIKHSIDTIKEHKVCTITISNPKSLNSLNTETLKELNYILDEIDTSKEIDALIITGDGDKSFVAGADIAEMSNFSEKEAKDFAELGVKVFQKIENIYIPVIAAINGYALGGGCELAMACDIRIASENAKFAQPEVGLGIIPGFFGNYRLARLVGIGRAKELIFTGRTIKSQEALTIGLVNQVVPQQDLTKAVINMLEQILDKDLYAVSCAKEVINFACNGFNGSEYNGDDNDISFSIDSEIDDAQYFERNQFAACFEYGNAKEQMKTFLENQAKKNSPKEKK